MNKELNPELKQTAVDWLVEQLTSTTWKYVPFEERMEIFRKAKAMEKEQMQDIIDAYVTGRLKDKNIKYGIEYYNKLDEYIEEGKDYYRKTYEQ